MLNGVLCNSCNPWRAFFVCHRNRLLLYFVVVCLAAPSYAQQRKTARVEDSTAEVELQKAITLTRSGKFLDAIPIFQAIRGQVRDLYAASFNLALCYLATGQYQPATAALNELRSSGFGNANVENLLAQSLLGSRQPEEAYAAFERASRLTPADEKLYVYLAESCMDNGYFDLGIRVAEMGLKNLPRSARIVFEHAMLLSQLEFLDEAKQELQKVTELAPGSDVAYIAAAQKSMFEGNAAEALRFADEGILKGKEHTMLLALYGEAAVQSGVEPGSKEFATARSALEKVVAQRPSYASAQISLGKLYLMEGRLDDAIEHLTVARELAPRNRAVYSNLAAAYRRKGDSARAEETFATLEKLNREEEERIRTAPGDRKAAYTAKPVTPARRPPPPPPRQ